MTTTPTRFGRPARGAPKVATDEKLIAALIDQVSDLTEQIRDLTSQVAAWTNEEATA